MLPSKLSLKDCCYNPTAVQSAPNALTGHCDQQYEVWYEDTLVVRCLGKITRENRGDMGGSGWAITRVLTTSRKSMVAALEDSYLLGMLTSVKLWRLVQ